MGGEDEFCSIVDLDENSDVYECIMKMMGFLREKWNAFVEFIGGKWSVGITQE